MHKAFSSLAIGGIAVVLISAPATAEPPREIRIEVDFNVYTGAGNRWTSTGAFVDEGSIRLSDLQLKFPASGNELIKGSMDGRQGSFKWQFAKKWTADPNDPNRVLGEAHWAIVEGTGAYEGLTGQGTVTGSVNLVTGALHDSFVGKVQMKP